MTRSAKAGPPGFTLLEMIIALFILSLLTGMAVVGTRNILADEELRKAVRELQIFAKTARKEAQEKNRTLQLSFAEDSVELRQLPDPRDKEKPGESSAPPKILTYHLPENVQWQIKLWGTSKWDSPKDVVWLFPPSGLCAPHRFRFEKNQSWMEFSFNPLTANPQEEDFYLP